jgi:nucleoside-diphosphate-sugar epimerase
MQTILGSGGAIGIELAKALTAYTKNIRLVSRHPEKVNATDELMQADLLIEDEVRKAVEGSSVVYLTAGLPYDKKVWKTQWPVIMTNVIAACKQHQAKLVFFDNVYMYDKNYLSGMTEETPVNPPSEKAK